MVSTAVWWLQQHYSCATDWQYSNHTTKTGAKNACLWQATGQFGCKLEQENAKWYKDATTVNATCHGGTDHYEPNNSTNDIIPQEMVMTVSIVTSQCRTSIDQCTDDVLCCFAHNHHKIANQPPAPSGSHCTWAGKGLALPLICHHQNNKCKIK